MALLMLPTNVRLPTLLDDLREDYLEDRITVEEFEGRVAELLATGNADDASDRYGMSTAGEWR